MTIQKTNSNLVSSLHDIWQDFCYSLNSHSKTIIIAHSNNNDRLHCWTKYLLLVLLIKIWVSKGTFCVKVDLKIARGQK